MLKLNVGCGDMIIPGYDNLDLYSEKPGVIRMSAEKLDYPDDSVDEIYACHIIEHFDWRTGIEVLKEWRRVLKPGGNLVIECPDFIASCRMITQMVDAGHEKSIPWLYGHFFSDPWNPGFCHKFLYSVNQLKDSLVSAGFDPNKLSQFSPLRHPDKIDICIGMIAEK